MSCPATGVREFTILNNVTITDVLNQSIFEASTLDVQWAKRGTVPTFQQNYLNEGIYSSGEQTTTLRIRGNQYSLKIVKISEPLNTTLVSTDKNTPILAEITMVFSSSSAITEKFVFLCIPIFNRTPNSLSPYLEAIRQDRLPGRPIGLNDLLPTSKKYTTYTTCLHQVTGGTTNPVQAIVLVFTGGLSYPKAEFNEILKKMKDFQPSLQQAPPLGALLDGLMPRVGTSLFLISTENDYKTFLRTSELSGQSKDSSGQRVDSTDSYKCVPLNPDQTVKNNRLIIDTDKGIPLTQVLKEKTEEQGEAKITPGMVERMIAIVLGSAAGIFILSILAYIFSRVTSDTTDESFPWLMDKTKDLLPMVFVSMVVGIIGFLIGFFTSTT